MPCILYTALFSRNLKLAEGVFFFSRRQNRIPFVCDPSYASRTIIDEPFYVTL